MPCAEERVRRIATRHSALSTRHFVIGFAAVLYLVFLIRYSPFAAAGSDASGYLNAAHLISEGRLHIRVAPLDVMQLDPSRWRDVFLPLGFAQAPDHRYFVPSYPLGYPLHLMVFGVIGGWNHAPYYVTPLAALLTVFVLYKIARELGMAEALAVCAAVILAISPGWVFQALQPMSDVLAALWCSITVLCAMRSDRSMRWAIACGAAFAIAVWVRPSNLLLAIAIAFAMRWNVRRLAIAVASSIPFGIALMITNKLIYGKAATTGYGAIGELMTWGACGPHQMLWLLYTLTPIIFPIGLLVAFDRHVPGWQRWALLAWFLPFLAFYSSYAICDAWWYLRFLLPAYPPIILAAFLLIRDFVRWRAVQLALAAAIAIVSLGFDNHYNLWHLYEGQRHEMHTIHWAEKQLPKNALVVTMQMSGSYYYYTGKLAARYDILDPARFEELRAYAGNAGLQWYALVYDWEEARVKERMPGNWVKVGSVYNADLLRLAN